MTKEGLLEEIRKYQKFVVSFFIFFIIFLLTSNYLLPNIEKIKQLQKDMSNLNNRIAILQQKVNTLSAVDKNEELTTLKKIVTILPEEKDVYSIFTSLDALEKDSSVFITQSDFRIGVVSTESAKINRIPKNENYDSIDIAFSVAGTKDQIIALLNDLTSFKTRLFTARDVSVNIIDDSHVTASFTLTAYYSPFPPIIGNIDSSLPSLNPNQLKIKKEIANITLPSDSGQVEVTHGKANLFQ